MERVDLSWDEVLGVGLGSAKGGKMGQKQYELAADYGDRLGDERGSVWRRMNKGPFGRQCDISKLLADPLPGLASEEAVFLLLESA